MAFGVHALAVICPFMKKTKMNQCFPKFVAPEKGVFHFFSIN
jgi:hypothetical protein